MSLLVARDSDRPEGGLPLGRAASPWPGGPRTALEDPGRPRRSARPAWTSTIWLHMGLAQEDLGPAPPGPSVFPRGGPAGPPSLAAARFHCAAALDGLGAFLAEAEPEFLKVIALDPDERRRPQLPGLRAGRTGASGWRRALSLIRRAVALEPENGAFLDSLGWCLFKMGRLPEAEGPPWRGPSTGRREPTIWEHYGDVLEGFGAQARTPSMRLAGRLFIGPAQPASLW